MPLYGREAERAALSALMEDARASRSGVLVIRGDAGAGKTALLDDATAHAEGMRVMRAVGVQSEAELSFAALHQLLWPLRSLLGQLTPAQAAALGGALGVSAPAPHDRFLVGAATLELLAAAAEERPLMCVVDDAQCLDGPSADAIAFAARRLHAEPIALLLAIRDGGPQRFDAAGMPELRLGGLDHEAARALLGERAGAALPEQARAQILQMAQGNPLALLELPLTVTGERLPGGQPSPLTPTLREAFLARTRSLPEASRRLLVLAAADTTADPVTVLAAARKLGIGEGDVDAVEAAGLLRFSADGLTFRHPLVREAAYDSAPFSERAAVHRALADFADPDRRAWHRAAAAGLDDEVADALEESARRARARSGFGPAAAALQRAGSLTTDPRIRARRLTAAAEAAWLAGRPASAAALLHEARDLTADPATLADIDYIQALTEMADATPADAYLRLVRAADAVTATDPARAQKLLLQAREAAVLAADTPAEARVSRQAEEMITGPPGDPFPAEFLGGIARWLGGDIDDAVPRLRHAVLAAGQSADPRRLFWAGIAAFVLGDDPQSRRLFQAEADQARSDGSVAMLAQALTMLASGELLEGRAASARASATEGLSLARATGQHNMACFHLATLARVAASFGTEDETRSLVAECYETILTRRLPLIGHMTSVALGEMELSRGRADRALAHLGEVAARGLGAGDPLMRLHAVPALVEASVRAGQPGIAAGPVASFARWFTATGSPPNLALLARIRALLAPPEASDPYFAEALRLHAAAPRPFDRARTELLYGESLRRRRERRQARQHLRVALDIFERSGADPWAERARAELRASGESIRRVSRPGPAT